MKLRTWLIIGAVGYAILNAVKPSWYDDLMNRAYAPDHLAKPDNVPPDKWQMASMAATAVGLPVGWLIDLSQKVKPEDLPIIAQKLKDKVLSMGAPADTKLETLAAYKKTAIDAVTPTVNAGV